MELSVSSVRIIAYALQKTGKVNVTAVARSNYQAVSEGHMVLRSEKYGEIREVKPSRVVRTVAEAADAAYDFVVITTKAIPELYPTSEIVAPLHSENYKYPQPIYVLMQNGLGVERNLYAALQTQEITKSAAIVTGSILIMTNMIGDTVVHGDFASAPPSRYNANFYRDGEGSTTVSSAQEASLHNLIDLLNEGGCEAKVDPHVQAAKFKKNLWNASLAMLSCLTRTPCCAFFNDDTACQGSVQLLRTIATELVNVGRALGYPSEYLTEPVDFVEHYRKHHLEDTSGHKPSTLLDVEAGKPFELEVILGEVVRLAKTVNVPVPTLETMYHTLNIVQRQFISSAAKKQT
ncbi:hypothetical protein FRB90_009128 [Tulasnella sp. 427]|nr:hypothetical protein FRB90_009128 [Tulasnella sp. 427]